MLIDGKEYEIIDILSNITLADSFVLNKTCGGHGEAKLYVGNYNERYRDFFDNLDRESFFLKRDFENYIHAAEEEFQQPQQQYIDPAKILSNYGEAQATLKGFKSGKLKFRMRRVDVEPPRVYLKSDSEYYEFVRTIGLPNFSYLSVMKLRGKKDRKIAYYWRIFFFSNRELIGVGTAAGRMPGQTAASGQSVREVERLVLARIGQGEYRRKLLMECHFCPFTSVTDDRLLIASHIKPWAASDDKEKVDPKNGFVFTPTFDKLFDNGFITFTNDKIVRVSPWISLNNQKYLGIYDGMQVEKLPIDDRREVYLVYHRENVYKA